MIFIAKIDDFHQENQSVNQSDQGSSSLETPAQPKKGFILLRFGSLAIISFFSSRKSNFHERKRNFLWQYVILDGFSQSLKW